MKIPKVSIPSRALPAVPHSRPPALPRAQSADRSFRQHPPMATPPKPAAAVKIPNTPHWSGK